MYLPDQIIKRYLKSKKIISVPEVKDDDIRTVGIRVHLANEILIPLPDQTLDLANPTDVEYRSIDLTKETFVLKPGEFILAALKEKVQISRDLIAFIDGRSTIARLGLTVHVTSTTADGLYDMPCSITLEIANVGNLNIKLAAGYPIGMMLFAKVDGTVESDIQSQYKGQESVTPPNLNFKRGEDK